jgi:proteasome lid subunit RPN8/RPN11
VITALILPGDFCAQIFEEARAAFPRECCGLIEGVRDGDGIRVRAIHPARNLAAAADRFEIDPAAQFRLMRELRGSGREIVGCYHSHTYGRAEPSAHDLEHAVEEGFVWLIAALDAASQDATLAAIVYGNRAFARMALTIA